MPHRRPPLHHDEKSGGTCRWCGEPILHEKGPRAGQPNRRRAWHDACVSAYRLAAWPKEQVRFVRKRDGARCAACGASPKKWLGAGRRTRRHRLTGARYTRVRHACALELDHTVPLWSIAHLPPDERRAYFGPDNLKLLCPACHRAKTAREAAERAALKRAAPAEPSPPLMPAKAGAHAAFEPFLQAFVKAAAQLGSPLSRG